MNFAQSSTMNCAQPIVRNMSMGDRLQTALSARSKTPPDVITACKLSKGAVYNILNDVTKPEKVRESTVRKITTYLDINRDWLVWGRGRMTDAEAMSNDSDWSDIIGVRQTAALGDGAEPDEYAETHKLKFRSQSLARKKLKADKLAVIYGKGDSMYPTIKDGDAIMIDTSDTTPKDDCLFVITYERELYAKRLLKLGNQWFIDSDNKADPKWKKPRAVDETKGFEIHGRVRWVGSWVD